MQFIVTHIWWILGGIVVIVPIAAWLVLSSGTLNRLRDSISPASDKYINAKLFCEDKQIRDRKLKVDTYCITDEKKMSSYHLVHTNLLTGKESGKQFLPLNERDEYPINFNNRLTPEKRKLYPDAQRVYIDTANDIDNKATSESAKNMMGISLSIIAMAGALVFIVFAIIVFWKGRGG